MYYASLHSYMQDEQTALMKAAKKGHGDVIDLLLSYSADIEARDKVI